MHPCERRRARRSSAARAGYSLLETIFSLSVLSILVASAALAASTSGALQARTGNAAQLDAQAARSVRAVAQRLRAVDSDSLFPVPGDGFGLDTMTFRTLLTTPTGGLQWSPVGRFELEPEPGEGDDGIDNDGDGLIDEQRVVLLPDIETPDRRIVVARDVPELLEGEIANGVDDNGNGLIDEAGLCFSAEEGILTVRVSVAAALDGRRVTVRTAEQSLRLRN
jgi:type II secretory pathway pseudopilin PulG